MILRSLVVLVLAGVTTLACRLSPEPQAGDDSGVIMQLPAKAGEFAGVPLEIPKEERDKLPADTEIVRMGYSTIGKNAMERNRITASIILAGAERRSIHRPEVCLTGQGWSFLDSRTIPVAIAPGLDLQVRDLLIERPVTLKDGRRRNLRAHYLYWFVGSDVSTPSHLTRMWLSTRDSVLRNVNHRWAYASLLAFATDNFEPHETGESRSNEEETLARMKALIREIAPAFQKSMMPSS